MAPPERPRPKDMTHMVSQQLIPLVRPRAEQDSAVQKNEDGNKKKVEDGKEGNSEKEMDKGKERQTDDIKKKEQVDEIGSESDSGNESEESNSQERDAEKQVGEGGNPHTPAQSDDGWFFSFQSFLKLLNFFRYSNG